MAAEDQSWAADAIEHQRSEAAEREFQRRGEEPTLEQEAAELAASYRPHYETRAIVGGAMQRPDLVEAHNSAVIAERLEVQNELLAQQVATQQLMARAMVDVLSVLKRQADELHLIEGWLSVLAHNGT